MTLHSPLQKSLHVLGWLLFPGFHTQLSLVIALSEHNFLFERLNVGFHPSWHQRDWLIHRLQHLCVSIPQFSLSHSNHLGNMIRFLLPPHCQTNPVPDSIFTQLITLAISPFADVLSKRILYMFCSPTVGKSSQSLLPDFFIPQFAVTLLCPHPSAESNFIHVTKGLFLLYAVLVWRWALWRQQKCQIRVVLKGTSWIISTELTEHRQSKASIGNHVGTQLLSMIPSVISQMLSWLYDRR